MEMLLFELLLLLVWIFMTCTIIVQKGIQFGIIPYLEVAIYSFSRSILITAAVVLLVLIFHAICVGIDHLRKILLKRTVKIVSHDIIFNPQNTQALAVCNVKFSNGEEINPRIYYFPKKEKYRMYLPPNERISKKEELFEIYRNKILEFFMLAIEENKTKLEGKLC